MYNLILKEKYIMGIKYDMDKLKKYGKKYRKQYLKLKRAEFRWKFLNNFVQDNNGK